MEVRELLDLVLPDRCAHCRGPASGPLCEVCLSELVRDALAPPEPRLLLAGLSVQAALGYGDVARSVLVAHKERGRTSLRTLLGVLLAAAVERAALEGTGEEPSAGRPLLLVPVPSTAAARRRRGRDPMRDVVAAAVVALAEHGRPARIRPVLRLARTPRDQASLGPAERAANLAGAHVALSPSHSGQAVVVVDDILTTGATLREADRALRAAGWDPGAAAVVAAVAAPPARPLRS